MKVLDKVCQYAEFIVFGLGILLVISSIFVSHKETKVVYKDSPMNEIVYVGYEENPYEAELTKLAIIETIGTSKEQEAFGYSFSTLLGIVYAESGGDYTLAKKIATCVANAQKMSGCTLNPVEVCEAYQYTKSKGYYNGEALQACIDVFLDGNVDEEVGDATMFKNSDICPVSCHNEFKYVCSYHSSYGEIQFFEE